MPRNLGVTRVVGIERYGNSGANAIALCAMRGAKRIVMLGYDCQHTEGRAHWHGNHPPGFGNAKNPHRWVDRFAQLAKVMRRQGVEVLNASRTTALECFPRVDLETALRD